jgi:hypothetical protein
MGLASVENVKSMDYCFNGMPFCDFPLDITVETRKMDYAFNGIPFVTNYQTTAVTTIVQMGDETITISDNPFAFNTTCLMSETSTISDLLSGVVLAYGMEENITVSDSYGRYNAACVMSEAIALTDALSSYNAVVPMSEALTISDEFTARMLWLTSLEESFGLTDDLIWTWIKELIDTFQISGEPSRGILSFFEILDTLLIYDTQKIGWGVTAESTLDLADSIETILGIIVDDWLTLIDSETNNWNGREIVPDTLNLYDVSQMWKVISDTLSESLDLAEAATWSLTITVLEYLGFADLAQAVRTSAASVNESVTFTDLSQHALSFLIEETLSAVDVSSVIAAFAHSIAESIDLADSTSPIKKIYETTTEPLIFTETVSSKGILYNLVYDTIAMNITVELGGEVYECYVLNTPKFMPSMYSGFDFNSYCVFENRAFGANDTGVYELTGDTDAGATIHTGAILNETDFESPNQKRFRRGYLGISGASPVMVFETEDGARQVYNIDTQGKLVASHELKSKKWKLSIADFESIDTIDLIPIILTK